MGVCVRRWVLCVICLSTLLCVNRLLYTQLSTMTITSHRHHQGEPLHRPLRIRGVNTSSTHQEVAKLVEGGMPGRRSPRFTVLSKDALKEGTQSGMNGSRTTNVNDSFIKVLNVSNVKENETKSNTLNGEHDDQRSTPTGPALHQSSLSLVTGKVLRQPKHKDKAQILQINQTYGDVPHIPLTDEMHTDKAHIAHTDETHKDRAHIPHTDESYRDTAHIPNRYETHTDRAHVPHTDSTHIDRDHIPNIDETHRDKVQIQHTDDTHTDKAHIPHINETHRDKVHISHTYETHREKAHTPHTDETHIDKAHIPHIIHQTWDTDQVPDVFAPWMQSWRHNHPDWEYWFWTQADVRLFLSLFYPHFLAEYERYEKDVYRANVMRYFVLYHFGGVYADLDLESLKPLDSWTFNEHCFLSEEPHAHSILLRQQSRYNAMITLLACRPRHPFFKLAIDMLPTYRQLEYSDKLLYIDTVYQKYNSLRHTDTHQTDTRYDDTCQNDALHNDERHNDVRTDNTRHDDTRHNNTRHKDIRDDGTRDDETRHNDTHHDVIRHDDTRHDDTRHDDTRQSDARQNDTLHNDTRRNNVRHNDTRQDQDDVRLVEPDYFLPTYDAGWTARIRAICQDVEDLPSCQQDVCRRLARDSFNNTPTAMSVTDHHWFHVVMLADEWKQHHTRPVNAIVPHVRDLRLLLMSLHNASST